MEDLTGKTRRAGQIYGISGKSCRGTRFALIITAFGERQPNARTFVGRKGPLLMAKDRPVQQLTYREKVRDATHLVRELIDHVGQSTLPRLAELQSQLAPRVHHAPEEVEDVTLRNSAAAVLESEHYAARLSGRMEELGEAIVLDSNKILHSQG
jgi:hypothetical protein